MLQFLLLQMKMMTDWEEAFKEKGEATEAWSSGMLWVNKPSKAWCSKVG